MIIIGERINASRPSIKEALEKRDKGFIQKEAKAQIEVGSQFLDVNCGLSRDREAADMEWLINTIQEVGSVRLSIDSPDPTVIENGIHVSKERVLINSITAEEKRYRQILPIAHQHNCSITALTIDENGMPDSADDRFKVAKKIYNILKSEGISDEDIYFDPLVRPISSEPRQAQELLKSIPMIKSLGGVKVVCGISNISYGLPRRSLINSIFLSMALSAGMDGALVDPLDKRIVAAIKATEAISGQDRYCMNFIQAYRKGLF